MAKNIKIVLRRPFPCLFCPIRSKSQLHQLIHLKVHLLKRRMTVHRLRLLLKKNPSGFLPRQLAKRLWHNNRVFRIIPKPKHTILKDTQQSIKFEEIAGMKLNGCSLTVDGAKIYKCPKCPKSFTVMKSLRHHLYRHTTQGEAPRIHQCGICKRSFTKRMYMLKHQRDHLIPSNQYACEKCGKNFKHIDSLREHAGVHAEEKNFPCPQCKKR